MVSSMLLYISSRDRYAPLNTPSICAPALPVRLLPGPAPRYRVGTRLTPHEISNFLLTLNKIFDMPTRAASRRLGEKNVKREVGANTLPENQESRVSPDDNGVTPVEGQELSASVSKSTPLQPSTSFTPVNLAEHPVTNQAKDSSDTRAASQQPSSTVDPPKRFRTRTGITRKSQVEREELRRAEETRRQERLANLPTSSDIQSASQGRTIPRGTNVPQRIRNQQALGPLGSDLSSPRKGRSRRVGNAEEAEVTDPQPPSSVAKELDTKVSDSVGSKSKAKGKGRAQSPTQKDDTLYVSSEDENDRRKRRDIEDIERISISSDEGTEISQPRKERSRSGPFRSKFGTGLRPIRADKEEHVVRPIGIAADSKRFKADTKQMKLEKEGDEMILKVPVANEDPGQAVDGGKPASIEGEVHADEHVMAEPVHPDHEDRAKGRKTRKSSFRDSKQVVETLEERLERERLELDLLKMREIWNREAAPLLPQSASFLDHDSDIEPTFASRKGQVFLMQFPPLTPMLVNPSKEAGGDPQSDFSGKSGQGDTKHEVKKEGRQSDLNAPLSPDKQVLTAANGQLPSGLAGKLKVHRSGKVTMDWGGADMTVGLGTEVNFLQDLVLTGPAGELVDAEAFALAQVREKLVVTPDWQKMYD